MKNIVPTHSFFTALVILSFSLVGFWSANAQTGKKAATLKGKITDAQTNAHSATPLFASSKAPTARWFQALFLTIKVYFR